MKNPMLQMLNQQSRPLNNNLMNMASPQAMLNNLMAQNPQVMNLINQYGGNPKTAFYELARQKGIDPNQILNMLRK